MKLKSTLNIAFKSLINNKLRTALTVLGVVIGIAAIIVVFSAGQGVRGLVLGQIESFGTDIIQTEIKIPTGDRSRAEGEQRSAAALAQGVQITTLGLEDMQDVVRLPNVTGGYGVIMGQEQVNYRNHLEKAFVMGTNASYIDIDKSKVKKGRFFTRSENRSLAKVAVLGYKMKDKLFGASDAIGKFIKIRRTKFRVIGVMEERGAVMTMDFDDYIYVPVRTLQERVMGIEHILYMVHQLKDVDKADLTAARARQLLRDNHNIDPAVGPDGKPTTSKDDFRVTTMAEMMEMLDVATNALTLLLLCIVVISLVVGGVGIMNIMYVIVSERTSEIGLRKAVGATYLDIMKQFLAESILITLAGGVIGILLGVGLSVGLALLVNSYGLDWEFAIPARAFVVAVIFSVVFGVFFGVYPARKAAGQDPIVALRGE